VHELISPTFNLAVLIGVLAYYLRQPLRDYVSTRHSTVRDELVKAGELLKSARERHGEFSAKLSAVDAEIEALRKQLGQDAQATRQRIVADAGRLASLVVADARTAAEGLYADLRSELYEELGIRTVERAANILRERLTGDDRARIREEFSSQVDSSTEVSR
jgi:F0F1-type ATP synthase membrane subunit b/b'